MRVISMAGENGLLITQYLPPSLLNKAAAWHAAAGVGHPLAPPGRTSRSTKAAATCGICRWAMDTESAHEPQSNASQPTPDPNGVLPDWSPGMVLFEVGRVAQGHVVATKENDGGVGRRPCWPRRSVLLLAQSRC